MIALTRRSRHHDAGRSPDEMIRRLTIGCLCVLALVAGAVLYDERPIFPTGKYVALVTSTNGTKYAATVYRPVMMPNRLVVHAPGVADARYNWFGIDLGFKVVGAGNRPRRRFPGLLYVSHGMGAMGVGILDPKIEDDWKVVFTASSIAFSNAWLRVQLEKD